MTHQRAYYDAQPDVAQEMHLPRVTGYQRKPRQQRRVRSVSKKHAARMPRVLYVMALVALVFCMLQCVRTVVTELYKMTVLVKNQPIIERYYAQTVAENHQLKDHIRSASSKEAIEAMARNYLNLTSDGEILVRLH